MKYDQYQQLYTAAKEQIAARVERIQPRAGNGASINGMGIAIEVPAAEEDVGFVDLTQYYVLAWYGDAGSFASAAEYAVGRFGEVDASFDLDYREPLDPTPIAPLKLTFQFVARESNVYRYAFPVRITLVQYKAVIFPDQSISDEPLRTVNLDLRREPVTIVFYYDLSDPRRWPQFVRLTQLVKI